MPAPPWSHARGVDAVVSAWLDSGAVRPCLAADLTLASSPAELAPLPAALGAPLGRALESRGIRALYSHQAEAIEAALAGRHVVIATPTASGKSLCFHLPVLETLARDPGASALYVFPTKALSRDQEHGLGALIADAGLGAAATVYDGDTPGDARRVARERCRIVLTNPDMLHSGILPCHTRWAAVFQNLRYVVLDELHTYRGVFGSHMAHVIARLRRIARFHGKDPTFITATATIGNPREHAARLLGIEPSQIALVDRSGAPRASRRFFMVNPPVVNAELGIRKSSLKQAVALAADLVRARVPTIVFGPSRNSVEVMLKYLREQCRGAVPSEAIMAYRGGYLPQTRRAIERGLRDGEIVCVVATNALELGIDIGDLDAVVCAGYPGSVAGTWQRFGRAGRRGATSIALLVCSSEAVDQFLARDPDYLLRAGAEEARIDPDNVEVLIQHLKCAAFEAPFRLRPGARTERSELDAEPSEASGGSRGSRRAEDSGGGGRAGCSSCESYLGLDASATRDALDYLAGHGLVHESGGRFYWSGEAFPASHVSLRNIGWDNFVIIDVATEKSIAELDWRAAHTMLHEQAIYQHDAEQYQVERLDYENHKAFVRKVQPDYFTTALTYRTVGVLEETALGKLGRARIGFGEVKVVEKVTGYKKIKFFTHENAGYGDVHLPEMQMHTTSFWLTVPEAVIAELGMARRTAIDGLRGLGAALETVSTLSLMCDPRDIARTLGDGASDATSDGGEGLAPGRDPFGGRTGGFDPTLFLFDAIPGGVGLAERIFERAPELVVRAESLIASCACAAGCPACVGPEEAGIRKAAALAVARALASKVSPRPLAALPAQP
jgi:DEAD/DEAH box helicase domain-containing protein